MHLPPAPHRRRQHGFSLSEMLAAVCICGTLAGIAVPSWQNAAHSMKLRSISSSFAAHVHLARSEAIKRNARVVVCKASGTTACAATGAWEQGWLVFHDANNNGTVDAGEQVLDSFGGLPQGYRFSGNSLVASYLSYSGVGMSRTTSGAFQAGTFTLCREGALTEAREIAVNALGRPKIRKSTVASCG
jgi:type IV fimbrial biogenesis protein FimT